jgi:tetratricopeptide (TPR) repeat protein
MGAMTILVSLLLGSGLAPTQRPQAAQPAGKSSQAQPVPAQLRSLLVAKNYGRLAETLAAKQLAFERSVLEEDALWEAFLSFSVPDPSLAQPLDDWVRASQDSWIARLARGYYLEKRGFAARGGAAFSRTPPQQLAGMAHFLDEAELDFRAALSRNGKLAMAHEGLMGIGQYRGDRAMVDAAYQSALRIAPASFQVRAARMYSLRPEWGGSYAEMKGVAAEAQQHVKKNPRLAALPGYVALYQVDDAVRSRDAAKALQLVSQAISTAQDPAFFSTRGWLHRREDRWAEALADLDHAIELGPHGWWYVDVRLAMSHYYKGDCLVHLERYDEAIQEYETTAQIDPYADEFLPGKVDMVRQMRDSKTRR